MISKELLQAITKKNIIVGKIKIKDDCLGIVIPIERKVDIIITKKEVKFWYLESERYIEKVINIHELANIAKEWAHSKNYHLNSKLIDDFWFCQCENNITDGCDFISEYKPTEYQTIFETCEWILNKENK